MMSNLIRFVRCTSNVLTVVSLLVDCVAHSRSFGLLVCAGTLITTFFFNKIQSQKLLTDECPLAFARASFAI
jgi:hypothetical protein